MNKLYVGVTNYFIFLNKTKFGYNLRITQLMQIFVFERLNCSIVLQVNLPD